MKPVCIAFSADNLAAGGDTEKKKLPEKYPTQKLGAQERNHKSSEGYILFVIQGGSFVSKQHQMNCLSLVYGPQRDGTGETNGLKGKKKVMLVLSRETECPGPTEDFIKVSSTERLYSVLVTTAIWPSLP